tara:strand:+ start:9374 stop:10042 length:669 start_codon:yes stop_codon:yes gene_type:complete
MCWFAALGTALTGGAATGAAATTIGGMATLQGMTAGASFIGQRQQARQQARYQDAASKQEAARLRQEQTAIRIRQDQEMQAKQNELFALQQRARASMARSKVAAGEAGVTGTSVDLLLDDYYRQMGNYQYALTREQGFQDVATGLALQDSGMRSTQTQIGINRPINQPSVLEGIASIASSVAAGSAQGASMARTRGMGVTEPATSKPTSFTSAFNQDYSVGF